jgi:hypothetical protein
MMVSKLHATVFVHIPKAAGNSIRSALSSAFRDEHEFINIKGVVQNVDRAHLLPHQVRDLYPEVHSLLNLEGCKSFAVTRHPLARAVSAYLQHLRQYGRKAKIAQSFEEYLIQIESGAYLDSPIFIHGAPQYKFVYDGDVQFVKKFFRLESRTLFAEISEYLGVCLEPRCLNQTRSQVKYMPTDKEISLTNEIYARDFCLFGY